MTDTSHDIRRTVIEVSRLGVAPTSVGYESGKCGNASGARGGESHCQSRTGERTAAEGRKLFRLAVKLGSYEKS